MNKLIHFCLHQKLVVLLLLVFFVGWGVRVAPFDWDTGSYPRDPVGVDAIPDLGDNQQIVYVEYPGRSPQDVQDQVGYPLTVSLLGIPGVKEVRSSSMFGVAYIYLIFKEDVEYYWSRSRILEKLNSLPAGLLPEGVTPTLGPDATGLGQVYQYVLEGRDPNGKPVGGWNPEELRSIQDWQVKYSLLGADGVAEVSSVGGFVKQYQVVVNPDHLRAFDVTLLDVAQAVRKSNMEVGARNLAINGVEYIIRGTGYVDGVSDLRKAVVAVRENTPITVDQVATVSVGPAMRRGVLDVNGADAVGGIVVARFGENPLAAIKATKQKIRELEPALPVRAVVDWTKVTREELMGFAEREGISPIFQKGQEGASLLDQDSWMDWARGSEMTKWPKWLNTSKVTLVPFYDRGGLIGETLNTLDEALTQQILVTIIVVVVMVLHLRSSLLISSMLPMAVLITFIAMKLFGVDANIVALSGIAIAIGTVVDVGIVLTENIIKHINEAGEDEAYSAVIYRAVTEVSGAVTTSVMTTVVSFLPVFTMSGEAGRLYGPLAYTKSFALVASIIVALTIIPPVAHVLFSFPKWLKGSSNRKNGWLGRRQLVSGLLGVAAIISFGFSWVLGVALVVLAVVNLFQEMIPKRWRFIGILVVNLGIAILVGWILAMNWMPLGQGKSGLHNFLFVVVIISVLLGAFKCFELFYAGILRWCLAHKAMFLMVPMGMFFLAIFIWKGFGPVTESWMPKWAAESRLYVSLEDRFPGLGEEFRPALDEGSFLVMPTVSVHASIEEAADALRRMDASIAAIPEVSQVVGKIGRADSALDPAPISMIETIVNYKSEYRTDGSGRVLRYRVDDEENFVYSDRDELIEDKDGKPFRQWRPSIQSTDDIWAEISRVSGSLGLTGAPKLQPIETRLVMLRTGMRSPMGIKIKGAHLKDIEDFGLQIERLMREGEISGVDVASINADRIVGKPYLEINPDRDAIKRYGLNIADVHEVIASAVGGMVVTTTVEGRERYGVEVRYAREARDSLEDLKRVLVTSKEGAQVPLEQLVEIVYTRGPQVIKSEDTFLTGYVTFGAKPGFAEVDVVEGVAAYLEKMEDEGELKRVGGVKYEFAGNYQSALDFQANLMVMLPLCLMSIFLILYLENRSVMTTMIIFMGIAVAWSGGFFMLWCYGQPGFLNFEVLGYNLRELFHVSPVNLSTAVWVGFIALFGIATDDGVVIASYLRTRFDEDQPETREEIREATVLAGKRRVRPCLMTTATTLLALLPVLTSTGRGADIMGPMAVPIFGGMALELLTMFVVPVLFCLGKELRAK